MVNRYWLGKKRSIEDRLKMSKSHLGKKLSEKHREKIRLSLIGNKHTLGKKAKLETRMKMSEKRKGEKHWNWKGGISKNKNKFHLEYRYKIWRKRVFERDNYTCQKYNTKGGKLEAHHIFNSSSNPKLRYILDNGVTLSKEAHIEFHKRYGYKDNTWNQFNEFVLETLLDKSKTL